MSVLRSVRVVTSVLVCAIGSCLLTPGTTLAQPSCESSPPTSFDVRQDPFNLSASERDAIIDVLHAFALTWDLRDDVNLPLLFIDGSADDGFWFTVCSSAGGVAGFGTQIIGATSRVDVVDYFRVGPFAYVQDPDEPRQARHFISNAVVKSHVSGDVKVIADLLVTLQSFELKGQGEGEPQGQGPLPVLDWTGMIEAVLTKEWGGVWRFRELIVYMDVPYAGNDAIFRGR